MPSSLGDQPVDLRWEIVKAALGKEPPGLLQVRQRLSVPPALEQRNPVVAQIGPLAVDVAD